MCIFVGHSVSSMIGVLAAIEEPQRFARLILIGPSPRYINEADYVGGFERGHRGIARHNGAKLSRLGEFSHADHHAIQSGRR